MAWCRSGSLRCGGRKGRASGRAADSSYGRVVEVEQVDLSAPARPTDVVKTALDTLDRRSAPPSVITNGRPLALASKFLPRRQVVRFMGRMARRQRAQHPVAPTNS